MNAQMRAYLAREMSGMLRKIQNSEEWLCAQALRGVISYESEEHVSFEVDFGRDADLTVTLTGTDLWTDAASDVKGDFLFSSELINDRSEGVATDVVFGSEARAAFLSNAKVLSLLDVNPSFIKNGQLDLTQTIRDDGALLLGVYAHSVRVWSYARKVTLPDELGGGQEDMIRPKFAEFIWRSPEAERVVYYGGIRDMKAIGAGKVLEAKRFSKSWEVEDPSARMLLIESNPLPCNRRPDTSVSMQVVA